MSGESVIALVAVITSGVVGVVSIGFNFWNSSRERGHRLQQQKAEHEDQYRAGLYEKRLEVHQQAFTWTQRVGRTIFLAESRPTDDQIRQLDQELRHLSDWFNTTNLYLDPVSMHELVCLLPFSREWVSGTKTRESVTQQIEKAQEAIVKGIGLKHIDFSGLRDDLRKLREGLDAK